MKPKPKQIGVLAVAYMKKQMAMSQPFDDQEQNWILGHLCKFASERLRAASRERNKEKKLTRE